MKYYAEGSLIGRFLDWWEGPYWEVRYEIHFPEDSRMSEEWIRVVLWVRGHTADAAARNGLISIAEDVDASVDAIKIVSVELEREDLWMRADRNNAKATRVKPSPDPVVSPINHFG